MEPRHQPRVFPESIRAHRWPGWTDKVSVELSDAMLWPEWTDARSYTLSPMGGRHGTLLS